MSELVVRLAEPRDDAAVGELLVDAFVTAYAAKMPEVVVGDGRRAELRAMAEKRAEGTVLVAELDGAVIGTVLLYRPGYAKSEAWLPNAADLRQLAVAPAHFGKGYSQALLAEAERVAWSWGADAICLHVRRGAHGLARMYAGRGFMRDPSGDLSYPHVELEAYLKRR